MFAGTLATIANIISKIGMTLDWYWLFDKGGSLAEYADRLYWRK